MTSKSIILLSGGLDSAVSLVVGIDKHNINLALLFDYGQAAFEQEKNASENLCKFYNIKLETIKLDWLKNITNTSLVKNSDNIPDITQSELDNSEQARKSMSKVWVPNRNGLFINIAACYADSFGYDNIIIGANEEEAATFSDNSLNFIENITGSLEFSTRVHPKVVAPLINLTKKEIIELGLKLNLPFEFIWSCYRNGKTHCGHCESCMRLKRGLESAGLFDILKLMFGN